MCVHVNNGFHNPVPQRATIAIDTTACVLEFQLDKVHVYNCITSQIRIHDSYKILPGLGTSDVGSLA